MRSTPETLLGELQARLYGLQCSPLGDDLHNSKSIMSRAAERGFRTLGSVSEPAVGLGCCGRLWDVLVCRLVRKAPWAFIFDRWYGVARKLPTPREFGLRKHEASSSSRPTKSVKKTQFLSLAPNCHHISTTQLKP